MRTFVSVGLTIFALTSLTSVAAAKAAVDDDDDEIVPMPRDYARPPRSAPVPVPVVQAQGVATRDDDDDDDDRAEHDHWRLEGSGGWRYGTFLVNGIDVGSGSAGHLGLGLRKGRYLAGVDYQLGSITLPASVLGLVRTTDGAMFPTTNGRGLVHRFGVMGRYSFARVGESDGGADLFVEGGLGVQHVRWDEGGVWTRPDLSLGIGGTVWGQGEHKHGGLSAGLHVNLAARSDTYGAPISCGGPCDMPTTPTGVDRSFMFDLTLMFGR